MLMEFKNKLEKIHRGTVIDIDIIAILSIESFFLFFLLITFATNKCYLFFLKLIIKK